MVLFFISREKERIDIPLGRFALESSQSALPEVFVLGTPPAKTTASASFNLYIPQIWNKYWPSWGLSSNALSKVALHDALVGNWLLSGKCFLMNRGSPEDKWRPECGPCQPKASLCAWTNNSWTWRWSLTAMYRTWTFSAALECCSPASESSARPFYQSPTCPNS